MNNPQDLSLVTRCARRRQRVQNATARRPNIPPPPPTQQRAPQTACRRSLLVLLPPPSQLSPSSCTQFLFCSLSILSTYRLVSSISSLIAIPFSPLQDVPRHQGRLRVCPGLPTDSFQGSGKFKVLVPADQPFHPPSGPQRYPVIG
ncbi:hypothetical protein M378DRAFT_18407 [Amanita muscaria Koide BX008]|uniref:Uncharacterized protein n=1 Tax=Amanita muscaria (strain Koide BX008) TaxID=946122 RepID=A0A0C2W1D9_AMAMK|nr:hypothetical protein M378DRAFT_18407 [Amanita muscaria Koide BX008]